MEPAPTRDENGHHTNACRCGACYDPYADVEWLKAEIARLERLIYVYCDPMAMPDDDAKIAEEIGARMSVSQ